MCNYLFRVTVRPGIFVEVRQSGGSMSIAQSAVQAQYAGCPVVCMGQC